MSKAQQTARFSGQSPRVGIRPVIDGRRNGIRESLEGRTMEMGRSVAALLQSRLRHPDGSQLECVLPESCIGGVAEAAKCKTLFDREGVGVSITVTPCWCYGSETMDMDPFLPKAVWGFNGSERPGAVYLAAVLAGYSQKGLPAFSIYGQDVQDANDTSIPSDVEAKLLNFTKAGLAVAWMRDKSYLSLGAVSMGIAGSMVNPDFFQNYLGMRTEYVDMSEFTRRLDEQIYDQDEFQRALAWVKKNCPEGDDRNRPEMQLSREKKNAQWADVVKMTLIARDLMIGNPRLHEAGFGEEALGHNALIAGFQGQRAWTDHSPNGDFMEAILNSSFDWNGIRQPFIFATENDSLNAAGMLFNHLLTDRAQIFADVRTYWSPAALKRVTGAEIPGRASIGLLHLSNSGAAAVDATGRMTENGKPVIKPFWAITPEEVQHCLEATRWAPARLEYFRGGGYSSQFVTKGEMPVTMARLNLVNGLGPFLQLAEGYAVDLPEKAQHILLERTDPTWPSTWFVPNLTGKGAFKDVYSVMYHWGANHGAISYGHIGAQLITLASMLRIPVSMHNVGEEHIFRPSTWSAFGVSDPEGADYRACQNFGALYGR